LIHNYILQPLKLHILALWLAKSREWLESYNMPTKKINHT